MTDVELTPDAIADLLAGAAECREQLRIEEWSEGSPAAAELAAASQSFSPAIDRLIRSVDLWTLVATDHLAGLSMIIASRRSLFSIFPLLRSVLEHSAYVVWALDNQVDARGRAARAALVAVKSQEVLAGAASRSAGKGSETYVAHRDAYRKLREDVRAEFEIDEISDPYTIDGEPFPRITDIIEHFGERWGGGARQWIGVYDYLCGTANHPSFNAYEYFDLTDPTAKLPELSVDGLRRLLAPAMVPYLKALEAGTAYMGLPEEPMNAYIDRVNAPLGPVLRER